MVPLDGGMEVREGDPENPFCRSGTVRPNCPREGDVGTAPCTDEDRPEEERGTNDGLLAPADGTDRGATRVGELNLVPLEPRLLDPERGAENPEDREGAERALPPREPPENPPRAPEELPREPPENPRAPFPLVVPLDLWAHPASAARRRRTEAQAISAVHLPVVDLAMARTPLLGSSLPSAARYLTGRSRKAHTIAGGSRQAALTARGTPGCPLGGTPVSSDEGTFPGGRDPR